ncbi:MAG: FAD-dependent oxidoreductase [Flavobacterium sp.]|nr:MAG: FAD-dependent oxidoreductase [Flavobacterium sp.]
MEENSNPSVTSGAHKSFWIGTVPGKSYETLSGDIETDVLVIGGGISGLTTAYHLLKAGRKVALVEDGNIGSGESGRTTAHLSDALDDRYYDLEKFFGKDGAKLAAESHMQAIKTIENTVHLENIDCQFKIVDGYLFLHPSDKEENLEKEYESTKNVGLDTAFVTGIPGIKDGENRKAIRYPRQGQFHIMEYLHGLSDAIIRLGGKIYTNTKAGKIDKNGATANGYTISANHIVVATNTPINDLFTIHTKQHPYRTYVIAAKIKKGKLPYTLWWDTGDQDSKWVSMPYHYVRLAELDENYDVLISGGEDHKTGQADQENIPEENRYERLEAWTRGMFPQIEEILYRWSGQVMEPVDGLAYIGKNPGDENIYIITGDSGNGMTHGTIGGLLVTDLILGRKNPYEKLYDPSRINLSAASDFLQETGNMAAQYLDWVTPEAVKDADALSPGEGGIITSGLKKTAVYRDEQQNLHSFSAICPHLGCIVQWNADEKSFDCPCHGSRFTCYGKLVNGPAVSDLKQVEIKK